MVLFHFSQITKLVFARYHGNKPRIATFAQRYSSGTHWIRKVLYVWNQKKKKKSCAVYCFQIQFATK